MLGAVCVDHVLMDELGVAVSERVIGQLVHQGATFAGRIRPAVRFQAEARPLHAAARADADHVP
jgi:hypothetical protein